MKDNKTPEIKTRRRRDSPAATNTQMDVGVQPHRGEHTPVALINRTTYLLSELERELFDREEPYPPEIIQAMLEELMGEEDD